VRKGVKIGVIATIVYHSRCGAYYLASPLFFSTEVDEPLPTTAVESEAYQRFVAMNEEEKMQAAKQMSTQERDQIMATASKGNNSIDESMDQVKQQTQNNAATTNLLRTGSFVGVGDGIHNAEGTAKVIPLQDGNNILRLEDLRITNGPDLYIYLATDKSASDFVNVDKLKANNGNQNYDIPTETDLTKYDTVLIWCRPFSVLFGSAELEIAS
jgi:Electron transfer DM13